MKIYFDSCAIQRLLDSMRQVRIALEAEALLWMFALVESGQHELVSSEALDLENDRIPDPHRKIHAKQLLALSHDYVVVDDDIERLARTYVEAGLSSMDALHLASAETAKCDYLCTCDDRFLHCAQSLRNLKIQIVSPLELVEELNL